MSLKMKIIRYFNLHANSRPSKKQFCSWYKVNPGAVATAVKFLPEDLKAKIRD